MLRLASYAYGGYEIPLHLGANKYIVRIWKDTLTSCKLARKMLDDDRKTILKRAWAWVDSHPLA
jgi:hypothetical protein